MKKTDIIDTYNNLLPELQNAANHYQAATGQTYSINDSEFKQLGPHTMNWGKDDLERMLHRRQRIIREIKENEVIFINNRNFNETEEGKFFVSNLETKINLLFFELNGKANLFYEDFNKLLSTVGLGDWMMRVRPGKDGEYPRYIPSTRDIYFDIQHKEMAYASLHIQMGKDSRKGWVMKVTSSMHSNSGDIFARDEQFHQYKGYITICEHAPVFQAWMETKYQEMVHRCYDILNEIDKVDDALKDPYTAWKENE